VTTFEALYRDNLRLVHAVALSRVGEAARAEDLTQETFLRAWRRRPELTQLAPPALRAWLLTTLRNLAVDHWRREARERDSQVAEVPSAPQSELRLDLLEALRALEEADRELVLMRYLAEMNSREIGEALGIPEGTVHRRLARSRRVLADRLAHWAPRGVRP